jgi:hypothetical protein
MIKKFDDLNVKKYIPQVCNLVHIQDFLFKKKILCQLFFFLTKHKLFQTYYLYFAIICTFRKLKCHFKTRSKQKVELWWILWK